MPGLPDQCEWGLPVPHMPQEAGTPLHELPARSAAPAPGTLAAKVENFFSRRVDPHLGQRVPFQLLERTRTSLSLLQASQ